MKGSKHWLAALAVTAGMVMAAGCGGGGGGAGNASCRGIVHRYLECGAWEGGDTGCAADPETDFYDCAATCLDESSCADVIDYACNGETNACLDACLAARFVCDSGRRISTLDQCDGRFDCCESDVSCTDLSDEEGCEVPPFKCEEFAGEKIPGTAVCDGTVDCETGLDEVDCGAKTCGQ